MFGYVLANASSLSPEEKRTYKEHYCGLCRVLRERYGQKAIMAQFTFRARTIFMLAQLVPRFLQVAIFQPAVKRQVAIGATPWCRSDRAR